MTRLPTKVREKMVPNDHSMQRRQRLRLQRFGMALSTYAVVTLAAVLITRLGLGEMNAAQWVTFIGLGLIGNAVFFLLFYTNVNLRFSDPSLTREQIVYSAFWGMVPLYLLPEARPIVLIFYLPAFSFGMLRLTRRQYLGVVACVMGLYTSVLVLEYCQDRQGFSIQYELFLFAIFGILLTWFAIFGGFVSNLRQHLLEQNKKIQKAHEKIKIEIKERKHAQTQKDNLIVELKDALNKVKTLSGLLPICAACKKIRDDRGYWNQIESYIHDHSEAEFSHSICPECAKKLYPEFYDEKGIKSDTK
jgi:Na+/melibiose symporter-like transporter